MVVKAAQEPREVPAVQGTRVVLVSEASVVQGVLKIQRSLETEGHDIFLGISTFLTELWG